MGFGLIGAGYLPTTRNHSLTHSLATLARAVCHARPTRRWRARCWGGRGSGYSKVRYSLCCLESAPACRSSLHSSPPPSAPASATRPACSARRRRCRRSNPRDSRLTTHYSLLTTHYSLLATHVPLLTYHYSLLATHYSLLTTGAALAPRAAAQPRTSLTRLGPRPCGAHCTLHVHMRIAHCTLRIARCTLHIAHALRRRP